MRNCNAHTRARNCCHVNFCELKLIMVLFKYFKKEGPALPSVCTLGDSSLTRKDVEEANKELKLTLSGDCGKKAVTPHGKYNSYTPEERARIRKYAAENGGRLGWLHTSSSVSSEK